MARKLTEAHIWTDRALKFVENLYQELKGFANKYGNGPLERLVLNRLLPLIRSVRNAKKRNEAYDPVYTAEVVKLMREISTKELVVGRTQAMLVPDFSMKKNGEGWAQYARLVEKYGPEEARKMVLIIKRRVEEVQFIATILVMNDNGEIEELSSKPGKIEAVEENISPSFPAVPPSRSSSGPRLSATRSSSLLDRHQIAPSPPRIAPATSTTRPRLKDTGGVLFLCVFFRKSLVFSPVFC